MVFAHVFPIPRRWWLALAPFAVLVSADVAAAQQLRGPPIALRPSTFQMIAQPGIGVAPYGPAFGPQFNTQPGNQVADRYTAQLMPGKGQIPLLNNGSLQVSQNGALAGTPNIQPFTYTAALPIGDRLGKNAIFYDPDLDTNIGFTPNQPLGPGFPGPITPYPYQAINGDAFARQRLRAALTYSPYFSAFGPSPMYAPMMPMMAVLPVPIMAPMWPQPFGFGSGGPAAAGNGNVYGNANPNVAFAGFSNPTPDVKADNKANP